MNLSTTISPHQLASLELDPDLALEQALQLRFSHLRLPVYWSDSEPEAGNYNFSAIRKWLQKCEEQHQPVVLTLGVKAPRWPEFYWPTFLSAKSETNFETSSTVAALLAFVERTVHELNGFSCISHWQVENEPLSPSGPDHQIIPLTILTQEIKLVRSLDPRPILTTLWGNEQHVGQLLTQLANLSDVVGIDLYYAQYLRQIFGRSVYGGPHLNPAQLQAQIQRLDRPVWITELQAEPWEKDTSSYKSDHPTSCSPEIITANLQRVQNLGASEIFLWGYEYWLYRQQQGDSRYLNLISDFNSNNVVRNQEF